MNIDTVVEEVITVFSEILRQNAYLMGSSRSEIEERIRLKHELRRSLKNCCFGSLVDKEYVKSDIRDILLKKLKIDKDNIDSLIPFSDPAKLTVQDKFDIMLYIYKKDFGHDALTKLMEDHEFDKPKHNECGQEYYCVTSEDIERAYSNISVYLPGFADKLGILVQRVYQLCKGNGAIDEIRDMHIDGISAGVSGIADQFLSFEQGMGQLPKSYDSIWIFYKGKSIRFEFLGFGSEKELIRVCRNIYRFNNPGQLSQAKGYIVNEMADGSRVSVARPPFCESWVLFIRKFDSVKWVDVASLIKDKGADIAIEVMRLLIKGCMVTGITGEQGSGKTTLLMSLIGFIPPTYNLRIQELSFELHLRKKYPDRNIVTFRETANVNGQEGLDYQKKTDGSVNILGEVATAPVASWLVQMATVGSLFTLFTHHAKTTKDLVIAMRNALLMEGGFKDERIATEQVTDAINFDIHMRKDIRGKRFIERITEIIPHEYENGELTGSMFTTRNIIEYRNGEYVLVNPISRERFESMSIYLEEEDISRARELFDYE